MLKYYLFLALAIFAVNARLPTHFHAHQQPRNRIVDEIEVRDEPPHYKEYAKMARYLVHKAEWTSMGTHSTVPTLKGYPMVNVIAVADSARGEKSTGHMYFYLTNLDFTAQDLKKNNKLTILLSMDQHLECSKQGIDPMEPTCARIMISGSAQQVVANTTDFEFGTNAMQSRHPASVHWLKTHNFFLCKLDIHEICVLDYYGGPHFVTSEEYYNATLTSDLGRRRDTAFVKNF